MPDSPSGRGSGGLPGRHAGRPVPRPWERSFRCPSAARRRPAKAPVQRYEEFVALHDELAARSRLPLRQLWWAGAAAAFGGSVLSFAAVIGLRVLLGVEAPVFAGTRVAAEPAAASYALCVLAGTVQATALMHLLLATSARPVRSFAWIGGFAVVLLTVVPLVLNGPLDAAIATSGLNLAGGSTVVALLSAVVAGSRPFPRDGPPGRRR